MLKRTHLQGLRRDLFKSAGPFAQRVGCTRQHISHIENGGNPGSFVIAVRMAKLLGRSLDEVFAEQIKLIEPLEAAGPGQDSQPIRSIVLPGASNRG